MLHGGENITTTKLGNFVFFRTLKAQFENYKQQVKEASEIAAEEAKQSPDIARDIGQVGIRKS